ncbi:MAG: hypothetical protein Q8L13_11805 [Bradyrhizobium sp.]|uniref:hypothetical protein n=1 Tax=Bradyrhizobium sp. TaxID=376 RepID=UPI00273064D2|nr:hypothetical protein [Bradyrhizobium sp.]MDP1867010.1 hypothetical protein [Bradyrhizobium sp.]
MVFVPPRDRVLERSTSNSQTVFAVTGAADASFDAFSASMSVGDTTVGGVVEAGVAFRSGVLTYSATNEITVTTTKESKGTFSAGGIKDVFMGLPASVALSVDGAQTLSAPQRLQARSNLKAAAIDVANDFTDTTEATGAGTTAAQIIRGGLEILKKLFVTGIAAFTNSTAATSTTTGAVVISGGLGVALAGWFGGIVRAAGGFVSSVSPASAAALDTSASSAFSIANGGSQALAIGSYGLLIVVDGTNGYASAYLFNGGSVTTVVLSGTWVASTTTPAAGKLSVAWNGSGYSIYNNFGSTVSVRATGIRTQ